MALLLGKGIVFDANIVGTLGPHIQDPPKRPILESTLRERYLPTSEMGPSMQ